MGTERTEDRGAGEDEQDGHGHRHHVLAHDIRDEGHTVPMDLLHVAQPVRLTIDEPARHRPLVDAEPKNQPEVETHQSNQDPRNQKHVRGEDTRQRAAGDDRASEDQMHHGLADEWRASGDGGADPEPPVRILIPAHQLPRKGHAERAQEEEHSDDPRQLSWVLVSSPQEDLDHVERHHGHHRVRAPEVHRPQVPSERRLVVEVKETLVRLVGRWHVDEGQADSRRDLENEEGERGASEGVPPARGAARDGVIEHGHDGLAEPRALFEPLADGREQRHCCAPLTPARRESGADLLAPRAGLRESGSRIRKGHAEAAPRRASHLRSRPRRDTGT